MKKHTAADIMTTPVITAQPQMRLTEAIELMLRWNISALPVVDAQNDILGIISEYDVMNFAFDGHAAEATVEEAMSRKVTTFPPETDVDMLVHCCVSQRMRRLPIVKDGKLVGIVSRRDILREIQKEYSRF